MTKKSSAQLNTNSRPAVTNVNLNNFEKNEINNNDNKEINKENNNNNITPIKRTIESALLNRKKKDFNPKGGYSEKSLDVEKKYEELKSFAMRLGSAFQKVNFLRDLKDDFEVLNRTYFPNTDLNQLDEESKIKIIDEIEGDFKEGLNGIKMLPKQARLGVYLSFKYYEKLLIKIQSKSSDKLLENRIRISNNYKLIILFKSYFQNLFNLI